MAIPSLGIETRTLGEGPDLVVDRDLHIIRRGNRRAYLPAREYAIFWMLLESGDRPLSAQELTAAITKRQDGWGKSAVRAYIAVMRMKLSPLSLGIKNHGRELYSLIDFWAACSADAAPSPQHPSTVPV